MCIICVKTKQGRLDAQAWERLENSFKANKDGAGFMYQTDVGVRVKKGYMTWPEFETALKTAWSDVGTDSKSLVCHFRIASRGTVCQGNCHPFAVSYSDTMLAAMDVEVPLAVVHNGTLPVIIPKDSSMSDTAVFVRDWLAPIQKSLRNRNIQDLLWFSGSKFAFMRKDAVNVVGNFEEKDGWLFSNNSYERWKPKYPTQYPGMGWDSTQYTNQTLTGIRSCDICGTDGQALTRLSGSAIYVCLGCEMQLKEDYGY